jgi:thiol-disulfide isomerase/thioredoxin
VSRHERFFALIFARRRLGCLALAVAGHGIAAGAQASIATPARCLKAANDYQSAHVAALRASGKPLDGAAVAPIITEARRMAQACGEKFDPATANAADFAALINLYRFYGDTTKAFAVVQRGIDQPNSPRERAELLGSAIRLAAASATPGTDTIARAEAFIRQLDALPETLDSLKILSHEYLMSRYDYIDSDAMIRHHALAILDLLRRTPMPAVKLDAYTKLARSYGDYGHADSALATLDRAERELTGRVPAERLRSEINAFRPMYELVGRQATPITGTHWLNAPPDQQRVDVGRGRVTLVQFTAHWCAPCRNSYPSFARLAARYQRAPVTIVFATDLYGFFGPARMDSTAELAADREYYIDHWKLPFAIAIDPPMPPSGPARGGNEARYAVGGIPEIVVIDKHGVIRQITVGWDSGNEARLSALIDALVAER